MLRSPDPDAPGAIPRPPAGRGRGAVARHVVRAQGRTRPLLSPGPFCHGSKAAPDIEAWREILRDAVVELDATPVDPAVRSGYTGWVYLLDAGAVTVTDVASDPLRAARTRRLIDRNPVDFCHLMLARRPSHTTVEDRHNKLRPGDAVLLDSTRQYSFTADAFAHYLSVNVPRAALIRDLRTTPELGRVIPAHDPAVRVLTSVVAELGRGAADLPPEMLTELGHTTSELLVSTLRMAAAGDTRLSSPRLSRRAQLLRMQDFVRRRFADPELCPQLIATA
ncbi:MAG TPA: hypothetical protein VLH10_03630, partial [Yinghuangia sp.]|nr:hypothetical protein [Yinghuangia sp.]